MKNCKNSVPCSIVGSVMSKTISTLGVWLVMLVMVFGDVPNLTAAESIFDRGGDVWVSQRLDDAPDLDGADWLRVTYEPGPGGRIIVQANLLPGQKVAEIFINAPWSYGVVDKGSLENGPMLGMGRFNVSVVPDVTFPVMAFFWGEDFDGNDWFILGPSTGGGGGFPNNHRTDGSADVPPAAGFAGVVMSEPVGLGPIGGGGINPGTQPNPSPWAAVARVEQSDISAYVGGMVPIPEPAKGAVALTIVLVLAAFMLRTRNRGK